MSIQIHEATPQGAGNQITNTTKLQKEYTLGYVPTVDGITQDYVLRYTPDSDEISTTIKFPPSITNADDDITISFITTNNTLANKDLGGNEFNLSNHEVTLYKENITGASVDYNFSVKISGLVLSTLTGSADEHIFDRSIEYVVRSINATTLSFELDPQTIHFPTLSDTTKFGYVTFYTTTDGQTDVVTKNQLDPTLGTGEDIFSVSYDPIAPGVQSSISATGEGFVGAANPNSYRIKFERINFSGDVNENYTVKLLKPYGGLDNQTKTFSLTSAPQTVIDYRYVTRLYDDAGTLLEGQTITSNSYPILARFSEGILQTPEMQIQLNKFEASNNVTAEIPVQDELKEYYIKLTTNIGVSQLLVYSADTNQPVNVTEGGTVGTRRFGPIQKNEKFYIEMTPQDGVNQIRLGIMHYGILTQTIDGTDVSSQEYVRETLFILDVDSNTGGPTTGTEDETVVFPPNYYELKESEMVKISTSAVTLKKILSIETDGTINNRQPVYDSDIQDSKLLQSKINEYGYDNLLHIYEFDVQRASSAAPKECYLQYRKVPFNASFNTTDNIWYDGNSGGVALLPEEGWYNVPRSETSVVDLADSPWDYDRTNPAWSDGFGRASEDQSVVLGANQQAQLKNAPVKQTVGLLIGIGSNLSTDTLQKYEFRSKIIKALLDDDINYEGAFTSRAAIFDPTNNEAPYSNDTPQNPDEDVFDGGLK